MNKGSSLSLRRMAATFLVCAALGLSCAFAGNSVRSDSSTSVPSAGDPSWVTTNRNSHAVDPSYYQSSDNPFHSD